MRNAVIWLYPNVEVTDSETISTESPQASEAMSYVAGYTVAHDVSARDWQLKRNGGQWLLGKTFNTYCPLGPVIVTTAALSGMVHFSQYLLPTIFVHRSS